MNKKKLQRMCILLNSLLIFIGELLTKVTSEKNLYSEYSDKNRVSIALANTPRLIMCSLQKDFGTRQPSVCGSAVGAVGISHFLFVSWFSFTFIILGLSWIFFSDLVFGLGFVCGNRI